MQNSAFDQGILDAKLGISSNPFKDNPKKTWWKEGRKAASSEQYADVDGVLLKDKPVYEDVPEN